MSGKTEPWTTADRTVLARTCIGCRKFLPGSSFGAQGHLLLQRCRKCHSQRVKDNYTPRTRARAKDSNAPRDRAQLTEAAKQRHSKVTEASRLRSNNFTRSQAHHHGMEWTGTEMSIVLSRPNMSAVDLGLMLGRTRSAVATIRRVLRTDLRYSTAAGEPVVAQVLP